MIDTRKQEEPTAEASTAAADNPADSVEMAGTTTDAINPDGTDTTADTAANTANEEPESTQADKPEATSLASVRQTLQSLWAKAKPAREAWGERPKLPYTLYAVVMVLIDSAAVLFIQWGMYSEPGDTNGRNHGVIRLVCITLRKTPR